MTAITLAYHAQGLTYNTYFEHRVNRGCARVEGPVQQFFDAYNGRIYTVHTHRHVNTHKHRNRRYFESEENRNATRDRQ